jgi:hypothetical protein
VDPLNLTGIITADLRVPASRRNRLLFRDGRLAAFLQGGEAQFVERFDADLTEKITRILRLTDAPHLREDLIKDLSGIPVA